MPGTGDDPTLDDQSLDGREFAMVSSTASVVDTSYPTRFRYRQDNTLVWGSYAGGTVLIGRFVGERTEPLVRIAFAHTLVGSGQTVRGSATSRIERGEGGRLRLVEDFVKDGVDHVSVCVESDTEAGTDSPA